MFTPEEQSSLETLSKSPDFPALEKLFLEYLEEIKNVMAIARSENITAETIGRQIAYKSVHRLLEQLRSYKKDKERAIYQFR